MLRHTFGGINKGNAIKTKRFSELTVIDGNTGSKTKVNCLCDCGEKVCTSYRSLFLQSKTSCDKCKDNRTQSVKLVDEAVATGFRIDMLKAESRDNVKTNRLKAFINMRCDCGNLKSYEYRTLLKLQYGSCGCYKPKIVKPNPLSQKALDIKYFTDLEVVGWEGDDPRYVLCKCKCGTEKSVRSDSLVNGDTTSCGCRARRLCSERFKGKYKEDAVYRHPLYSRYKSMFGRCYNEKNTDYKHYGGRGIGVCQRWTSPPRDTTGFSNFLEDMEDSYYKGSELERLDVNGDYYPENCTWVCRKSQVNNLRRNRKLKGFGIELDLSEWGWLLNFNEKMLGDRLNKLGWNEDLEDILLTEFRDRRYHILFRGEILNAGQVWDKLGYTLGQVNGRLTKHGDNITALKAEGIEFGLVKEREKDVYTFEEGLKVLRENRDRTPFEDHLLFKIEQQIRGANEL